jgi:hypothetical protein
MSLQRLSSRRELQVGQKREWCSEGSVPVEGIGPVGVGVGVGVDSGFGAGSGAVGLVERPGEDVVCIFCIRRW